MKSYVLSRFSVVLVILVLLTTASLFIGASQDQVSDASRISGVTMLILAFFKVRLVIREFMEVRHAPVQLRWVCDAWLVVAVVATTLSYLGVFN